MKMCLFWLQFLWNLFPWVHPYVGTGLDYGLAPTKQQAITWTNDGLVYWHTYVSLGLELKTRYMTV